MNNEPLTTRWLIRRDMEACLEIPGMHAWDNEDLLAHCKRRNGIATVCELDHSEVQGWMAYTLHQSHIHLANIATSDWEFGACYELVQRLINKLSHLRRTAITIGCPDDQDDVLVFLRNCGFACLAQHNDIVEMRYDLPSEIELCSIDGVPCRRSTGFPCLVPGGECNE